eukprot:1148881-Pelagomonas_calceolata.AAC.13
MAGGGLATGMSFNTLCMHQAPAGALWLHQRLHERTIAGQGAACGVTGVAGQHDGYAHLDGGYS